MIGLKSRVGATRLGYGWRKRPAGGAVVRVWWNTILGAGLMCAFGIRRADDSDRGAQGRFLKETLSDYNITLEPAAPDRPCQERNQHVSRRNYERLQQDVEPVWSGAEGAICWRGVMTPVHNHKIAATPTDEDTHIRSSAPEEMTRMMS